VDLPGLLVGIVEALAGVAFAQAVSAVDFTPLAVPSEVDPMEAASAVAPTGAAIAEVDGCASTHHQTQRNASVLKLAGFSPSRLSTGSLAIRIRAWLDLLY
jgi:hypothetical protein